ncbi:MAG: 5-formyltetrahydrofolate cyclo-ligase [Pseudomonadota bacterium]
MTTRADIRQKMRAQRRALDPKQRHQASSKLAQLISQQHWFRAGVHIACYLANDGEMDLAPLIERIAAMRKVVYLPVLSPGRDKRLWFAPYTPGDPLHPNQYGIPEPVVAPDQWLDPRQLDLVLMPLVAFDLAGNRLGMGGGYYDRSFEFLRRSMGLERPRLVGVAYEFQRLTALAAEPWDVPMHAVVTERACHTFKRKP